MSPIVKTKNTWFLPKKDPKGHDNLVATALRRLSLLLVMLLGLFFIYSSIGVIRNVYQKKVEATLLQREINELRIKNLKLQEELAFVQSTDFVEIQARRIKDLVKEEEKIVVLPDTDLNDTQSEAGNDNQTQYPPYKRWINVLTKGINYQILVCATRD